MINAGLEYQVLQNHSVFFYHENSDDLYVGGTDFVFKLDVDQCDIIEVSDFVVPHPRMHFFHLVVW